jgi:hypothetical protein
MIQATNTQHLAFPADTQPRITTGCGKTTVYAGEDDILWASDCLAGLLAVMRSGRPARIWGATRLSSQRGIHELHHCHNRPCG